ncbi:glycosyltransferase family 4 protein [Hymenobacter crusticola]|uniref:Glycosyltransferase subfamily 4-like N-terminal domain-containing protein n=1 Tax=Hymenobacter crusticola TaxID=1770526 RepID=A0A243WC09_9BACT|nr:glycosyltransferase family 4 protein [Hymenobacter crusticola]OUJ73159.1 hypothetical protein BXP70_15130 [Hymenobacter crusticola]
MRILISTWSLQVGGGEVLAMNLAAELVSRGHEVVLFNQRAELIDDALVQRLLPAQVKVLSMADNPLGSYWAYKVNALQGALGKAATFYEQRQQAYLGACLRRYRIELVSSHATYSDRICAPVVHGLGIPLVITEHGEYSRFIQEGRRDFVDTLRASSRILTVSKYNQQIIQQTFTDLPCVQTVYNGVRTDSKHTAAGMRQRLSLPPDAFVFGMVARGIKEKGWEQAIQAFQQFCGFVSQRPAYLVFIGGSDYLQHLQDTYATDTNIVFVGQVPDPDFYIAGFDVGLLPTHFQAEALPLAIIEYMISGKPAIATRIGGIAELLEPISGSAGQLIELNSVTHTSDVKMLAHAMRRYYAEPDLYNRHAHNAQQASRQFTMQTCAAQYEQAFQQVLAIQA